MCTVNLSIDMFIIIIILKKDIKKTAINQDSYYRISFMVLGYQMKFCGMFLRFSDLCSK